MDAVMMVAAVVAAKAAVVKAARAAVVVRVVVVDKGAVSKSLKAVPLRSIWSVPGLFALAACFSVPS